MDIKFFKDKSEDAFEIRRRVFVEEQKISPSAEFDGSDTGTVLGVVYYNGEAVATGRIIYVDGECHIGRVATLKEKRNIGAGRFLMEKLLEKAGEMGNSEVYIHAQIQAQGFYEAVGFKAYGNTYLEEGIEHISMKKELQNNI